MLIILKANLLLCLIEERIAVWIYNQYFHCAGEAFHQVTSLRFHHPRHTFATRVDLCFGKKAESGRLHRFSGKRITNSAQD
jgi:hypothetical protein